MWFIVLTAERDRYEDFSILRIAPTSPHSNRTIRTAEIASIKGNIHLYRVRNFRKSWIAIRFNFEEKYSNPFHVADLITSLSNFLFLFKQLHLF